MKQFRSDEGAVALIVALMLIVFVGFAALVVDMGYWYTVRRQLQTAADAAALAGCRELSDGKDNATIWAAVEDYVEENRVNPIGASVTIVPPSAGGESDITADSVKVTVSTVSTAFFGKLLGTNDNTIRAQARAKIGWIAGARNAVPWGLPIVRATRIVVQAGGYEKELEYNSGTKMWEGSLPSGLNGNVTVIAYNDQFSADYPDGVPHATEFIGTVLQRPSGARIVGVELDKQIFSPGETGQVTVKLASPLTSDEKEVLVSVNGKSPVKLTGGGTTFTGSITAPSSTDAYEHASCEVEVSAKKGKPTDEVGVIFGVRRATYPILHATLSPMVFGYGETGATQVAVKLNEYEYGVSYPLKVDSDPDTGKFGALDFGNIYAVYPGGEPLYEMNAGADTYSDYLVRPPYDPEVILEIGNVVLTKTGGVTGPTSRADWRLLDGVDFNTWEAAGFPQPTDHLVLVPVTERLDEKPGKAALRVVSFAWFYLEDIDKGEVTGVFVEDATAPGLIVVDNPPNHLAAQAVHLVSEDVQF